MIILALPPSANRIWRKTPRGMIKSDEYRTWSNNAAWCVAQQWQQAPLEWFGVCIKLPATRRDPDNSIKPLLDALQAGGAIVDDKRMQWLTLTVLQDRAEDQGALIELCSQPAPPPKPKAKRVRRNA